MEEARQAEGDAEEDDGGVVYRLEEARNQTAEEAVGSMTEIAGLTVALCSSIAMLSALPVFAGSEHNQCPADA